MSRLCSLSDVVYANANKNELLIVTSYVDCFVAWLTNITITTDG